MTVIKPKATAGIYAEVIKQIYDSLDKRIREAVSNAYDAHAQQIRIEIYKDKFMILDDGDGMSKEDLLDKYICLGGGDNYNNPLTIGRIGIGALSLFGIGDKIRIRTRKKGTVKIYVADIDASKIKNEDKHSELLEKIELGKLDEAREATNEDPASFTEIVIEELSSQVREIINDATKIKNLVNRLERILPVLYRTDDPLWEKLPKEICEKVRTEKYHLKVIIHIPHQDIKNRELKRRSITVESSNINIVKYAPIFPFLLEGGHKTTLQVYGYLFINADKKLPNDWQGINARVKNVSIESNTYFDYTDDPAATIRIGGELFILDLDENHAIQSNRSGFAKENNDYLIIAEYLHKQIEIAVRIVRDNDKAKSLVKKYINKLENLRNVFQQIALIEDGKEDAGTFSNIDDGSKLEEVSQFSLEKVIKKELQKEKLDGDVIWSGVLDESFHVELEDDDYYSIYVHDKLQKFLFNIGGNSISFIIGSCGAQNAIIIKQPNCIYINLDKIGRKDILNIEGEFVKLMLILYLNYLRCGRDAKLLFETTRNDLYQVY